MHVFGIMQLCKRKLLSHLIKVHLHEQSVFSLAPNMDTVEMIMQTGGKVNKNAEQSGDGGERGGQKESDNSRLCRSIVEFEK